jgi:hypothetical protein
MAKLEHETARDRDGDGQQRLDEPCDNVYFVHDLDSPWVALIRREQPALHGGAGQMQCLTIR